jgi:hypothetical protein
MKKMKLFECLGGNQFKLASPQPVSMMNERSISTEELQSMWDDDKDGEYVQINSKNGSVHYVAHGKAMEQICPPGNVNNNTFKQIATWFQNSGVSLNIWEVNDHGNIELYNSKGKALGGSV